MGDSSTNIKTLTKRERETEEEKLVLSFSLFA